VCDLTNAENLISNQSLTSKAKLMKPNNFLPVSLNLERRMFSKFFMKLIAVIYHTIIITVSFITLFVIGTVIDSFH
jgi:hypothetical protein